MSSPGYSSRASLHGLRQQNGLGLATPPHLAGGSASRDYITRFSLHGRCGNINPLSIDYACRPRLRSRLTLGGLTFPRKPGAFGGGASHPPCRYSFRHTHSPTLHGSSPVPLHRGWRRSPTIDCSIRDCGATLSPRHFRRGMARPVSCYALLKWWLLLSQHPGCHGDPTSFVTERRLGGLGRRSGLFPSGARSFSPAL